MVGGRLSLDRDLRAGASQPEVVTFAWRLPDHQAEVVTGNVLQAMARPSSKSQLLAGPGGSCDFRPVVSGSPSRSCGNVAQGRGMPSTLGRTSPPGAPLFTTLTIPSLVSLTTTTIGSNRTTPTISAVCMCHGNRGKIGCVVIFLSLETILVVFVRKMKFPDTN